MLVLSAVIVLTLPEWLFPIFTDRDMLENLVDPYAAQTLGNAVVLISIVACGVVSLCIAVFHPANRRPALATLVVSLLAAAINVSTQCQLDARVRRLGGFGHHQEPNPVNVTSLKRHQASKLISEKSKSGRGAAVASASPWM